jgi:hypothetical protein
MTTVIYNKETSLNFSPRWKKSGSGIYEILKEGFGEEAISRARVFFSGLNNF